MKLAESQTRNDDERRLAAVTEFIRSNVDHILEKLSTNVNRKKNPAQHTQVCDKERVLTLRINFRIILFDELLLDSSLILSAAHVKHSFLRREKTDSKKRIFSHPTWAAVGRSDVLLCGCMLSVR